MKTKIISFIFLMAFVITNVHCSADAGEVNPKPELPRPESPSLPTDENDLFVPQIEQPPLTNSTDSDSDESISYFDISMDQIRRNAVGQYSGTHNGGHIVLALHANNTYTMNRGGQEYSGRYAITIESEASVIDLSLRLNRETVEYYQLITYDGGVTILGISSYYYGPGFILTKNNEINSHNEL